MKKIRCQYSHGSTEQVVNNVINCETNKVFAIRYISNDDDYVIVVGHKTLPMSWEFFLEQYGFEVERV